MNLEEARTRVLASCQNYAMEHGPYPDLEDAIKVVNDILAAVIDIRSLLLYKNDQDDQDGKLVLTRIVIDLLAEESLEDWDLDTVAIELQQGELAGSWSTQSFKISDAYAKEKMREMGANPEKFFENDDEENEDE